MRVTTGLKAVHVEPPTLCGYSGLDMGGSGALVKIKSTSCCGLRAIETIALVSADPLTTSQKSLPKRGLGAAAACLT
jgi:hypothetical protein